MQQIRYVKKSSLLFYSILIPITLYILTEDVGISIKWFPEYRKNILIFVAICLIPQIFLYLKKLISSKYFFHIFFAIFFFGGLIYSAIISPVGYYSIYATMNLILFFIEMFFLMIIIIEKNYLTKTIDIIYKIILLLIIVNDLFIFLGVKFSDGSFETYFIGTKFSVVYLHLYFLAFYLLVKGFKSKIKKKTIFNLICLSISIVILSLKIDCKTGVLGCLLFTTFVILFNNFSNKFLFFFTNPIVLLFCFFESAIFAFKFEMIMKLKIIRYIIINILKRQLTLTGRTEIFSLFYNKMSGNWLWGYGFGSSYIISMEMFGYADAQNAILQWILQIGLPLTIGMVIIWIFYFTKLSRQKNIIEIIPLIALIYVFIILGTVEITFNLSFMLWMSIVYMWSLKQKKERIEYAR